jgi:hypothetical protein
MNYVECVAYSTISIREREVVLVSGVRDPTCGIYKKKMDKIIYLLRVICQNLKNKFG